MLFLENYSLLQCNFVLNWERSDRLRWFLQGKSVNSGVYAHVLMYNVLYIGCCMQYMTKYRRCWPFSCNSGQAHQCKAVVARINVCLEPLKMKLVAVWILFISGLSIVDNIGAWLALFGFQSCLKQKIHLPGNGTAKFQEMPFMQLGWCISHVNHMVYA